MASNGRRRRRRARYGIDGGAMVAPFLGPVQAALAGLALWALRRRRRGLAGLAGLASAAAAALAVGYLYSTGRGKLAVWAQLLDELGLHGDERVLDIGCGRGAVLILAARRLPRGQAVGVDVWRRRDQSGNSRDATFRNAVTEGVRDRVDVIDADARDLPFPTGFFDVVVSNLTIHNIRDDAGRAQALHQAARVLRPGGRLRIVDDRADLYAETLRAAGCAEIAARRLDWRTSFGIPGHHLNLVAACKSLSEPGPSSSSGDRP
ncbi:MAG TPA: class I SAM-dependent methyltransferase [Streptosporangiaceae bacterium]|nr:class I SAM-dependent methyltransferase [Streptosporangiaceae bacterium]